MSFSLVNDDDYNEKVIEYKEVDDDDAVNVTVLRKLQSTMKLVWWQFRWRRCGEWGLMRWLYWEESNHLNHFRQTCRRLSVLALFQRILQNLSVFSVFFPFPAPKTAREKPVLNRFFSWFFKNQREISQTALMTKSARNHQRFRAETQFLFSVFALRPNFCSAFSRWDPICSAPIRADNQQMRMPQLIIKNGRRLESAGIYADSSAVWNCLCSTIFSKTNERLRNTNLSNPTYLTLLI